MANNELEGVEKQNNKKTSASYAEIGSPGLERHGGFVYEEFLPQLQMPQCLKIYKEMSSNDAVIGSILFLYQQMARRTPWTVEAGGNKRVDKKLANLTKNCMHDMDKDWTDTVVEIFSFIKYGWSWHEIVYKVRDDGYIGWKKIAGRSQDTWSSWIYDKNDKLIGMEQSAPPKYNLVKIPLEKSLLFRTTTSRDNPEGLSLLRNAYRSWYFKKRIEEIEAIGVERDLAGLPVMTPPEGVNIWDTNDSDMVRLKALAEKLVSNIRRDQNEGVLKPPNWELELLSTGGRRQIDTNEIIKRYDQRIAITLLADIIMLGAERIGSFALADVKKSLLAAALEAQMMNIANVFNRYAIPRLADLNGFTGYTKLPKIVPGEVEVKDMNELAEVITKLRKLGVQFFPDEKLERYIRSNLKLPEKDIKEGYEMDFDEQLDNSSKKKNQYDDDFSPRETEDKKEYNETYIRGGRKD